MRFQAKVNKILDHYFIMEGQNEDRALAMLKKAGKEQFYNSLLELTADKNNKNKHLPILVKFFLEGQSIDIIKNYYDRYASNTKLNQKPIDNLTFQQFEQMVDSAIVSTNVKSKTLDDKPLYEDQNVKIYLGDTKEKCIKYGQGSKYGFCIARSDTSNLYWGYRSRGATFYFVYFKNSYAKADAPSDLIVIHAYPNEQYQVNYAIPNKDFVKSKKEIVNEFPALDGILGKVIVHREHTPEEKKKMEVNNASEIGDLKTLEDQLLFVEMGNPIHYNKGVDDEWKVLKKKVSEQNFNEILKKYIEVGMYDIPKHIIKGSKYEQRYKKKLIQRAEAKTENLPPMSVSALVSKLTPDETTAYLIEHKDKYSKETIDETLLSMVSFPNRYSAFIELYNFFHGEDRSKSSFAYNCVFDAISTSNIPLLNFFIDEKDCNVDNHSIPFYYLDNIITRSSNYTDTDEKNMIISHKSLSQIIDSYAAYHDQSNDEVPEKKVKELAREIGNLGYKDLVPNFLEIFQ